MIYGEKFLNINNNINLDIISLTESDMINIDIMINELDCLHENNGFVEGIKKIIQKIIDTFTKFIGWLANMIGKVFPKIKQFLLKFQDNILRKAKGTVIIPTLSFYIINQTEYEKVMHKWYDIADEYNKINIMEINSKRDELLDMIDSFKQKYTTDINNLSDELDNAAYLRNDDEKANNKYFINKKYENVVVTDKSSNYKEIEHILLENVTNMERNAKSLKSNYEIKLSNNKKVKKHIDERPNMEIIRKKTLMEYIEITKLTMKLDRKIIGLLKEDVSTSLMTLKKLYNPTKEYNGITPDVAGRLLDMSPDLA